ncbi:ChrR family anti-sigma-E factor [Oceanospirillum sanctuarii]|uniref:ChrR family anti-sigma-E factor n=1 Tax=Oceanospirillum sanctuarii TaxID=1434821 RepID=UPI000A3C316A|nr:ChrR family anti-sigma-E factor [Oceanospirillum sanctuarii]
MTFDPIALTREPEFRLNSAPKHHPDDATLVSYASGGLSAGAQLLLQCHLACCEHCRERVTEAEAIGGGLLEHLPQAKMNTSVDDIFAKLDLLDSDPISQAEEIPVKRPDWLPEWAEPVAKWLETDQNWQRLAPGISQIKFEQPEFAKDKAVRLLKISPGTCMPSHGHNGSELTLILSGSYCDETGRLCAGDVADLDPDIKHQPIADRDQDCICLIVTDAPLKFEGWIPKLMQPFFGL